MVGPGDLVDVRGGDGHHSADAEALDEPEGGEQGEARGDGDGEAGQRGHGDAERDGADPADAVAQPACDQRTEQHADRSAGDDHRALTGAQLPLFGQDGQCGGGQQLIERLEERDGADERADLDVPTGARQAFEPGRYGAHGGAGGHD